MESIRRVTLGINIRPEKEGGNYVIAVGTKNEFGEIASIEREEQGDLTVYLKTSLNDLVKWKTISSTMPMIVEYSLERDSK